jgi:hypothetical protein
VSDEVGALLRPRGPGAGEFHDALLGLRSLRGAMAALLARCPEVDDTAPASGEPSELAYALVGLCSLDRTLGLLFEALLDEEHDEPAVEGATWHRGHLR